MNPPKRTQEIPFMSCICNNKMADMSDLNLLKCFICRSYQHPKCIPELLRNRTKYICPFCLINKLNPVQKRMEWVVNPTFLDRPNKEMIGRTRHFGEREKSFICIKCLKISKERIEVQFPKVFQICLNGEPIYESNIDSSIMNFPVYIFNTEKEFKALHPKKGKPFNNVYYLPQLIDDSERKDISFFLSYHNFNSDENCYMLYAELLYQAENLMNVRNNILKINDFNSLQKYIKFTNDDEDMLCEYETVSFIDVYSTVDRIKTPCRGLLCGHLTVFDLDSYLIATSETGIVNCPICNRIPGLIYVDGLLEEYIKKYKEETQINLDWKNYENVLKKIEPRKEEKQTKEEEYISISDDEEENKAEEEENEIEIIDDELEMIIPKSNGNKKRTP